MKSIPLRQTSFSGVKNMKSDILWQLFEETGDPLCWLMLRRLEGR